MMEIKNHGFINPTTTGIEIQNNEMENQSTNPPTATANSQYIQQNTLIAGKNGKFSTM